MRRLPDWLGIGCVKCGTSWACEQLKAHPQIYCPYKELNYFNFSPLFKQKTYESFFEGADDGQLIGEWTPDYFHHYEAMSNIKSICPWVKMITIFRHPVERAFSNYKHALFEKRTKGDFNNAFNFWRVRYRSIYSVHLSRWYDLFPKEQIKILWYEDIKKDPLKFIKEMYQFLEVDDLFIPDDYNKKFEFNYHSSEEINNLKLSKEDREKWIEYYLPYIEDLEEMTGKDLRHWKV
jgi:hypothetical protein